MRKEESITIRLEADLLEAVRAAAAKDERSAGHYIRQVLKTHFQVAEAPCPSST
jgi:predicted DNA binding CopG/RHH family protein